MFSQANQGHGPAGPVACPRLPGRPRSAEEASGRGGAGGGCCCFARQTVLLPCGSGSGWAAVGLLCTGPWLAKEAPRVGRQAQTGLPAAPFLVSGAEQQQALPPLSLVVPASQPAREGRDDEPAQERAGEEGQISARS